MTKTTSGIVLAAGPLVSVVGSIISATANSAPSIPSTDWIYDLASGFGLLVLLSGLVMFFVGAMHFSRATK